MQRGCSAGNDRRGQKSQQNLVSNSHDSNLLSNHRVLWPAVNALAVRDSNTNVAQDGIIFTSTSLRLGRTANPAGALPNRRRTTKRHLGKCFANRNSAVAKLPTLRNALGRQNAIVRFVAQDKP
jgi:hypothetical protein